ncbi:MAG: MBL fold metallo-hydrolase, partial [Oscillospiraceae bacterium]|nr:MBL fold metallo-hydrolase [Oscillospiraceae bacterium]
MKRIFKILPALLSVLSGLLITGCTKNPDAAGVLTVIFLKVGKADGIVLQTAAHTVVIDCGEKSDGKKMVDFLEENGVKIIDYMILTHYDQDHIGGAA